MAETGNRTGSARHADRYCVKHGPPSGRHLPSAGYFSGPGHLVLVRSMGGCSRVAGPVRNNCAGRPRSPAVLSPVGTRKPGVHDGRVPENDQVIGWIREIVLDTSDPHRLAGFWAALLGGTPVQWYPGWVTLEPPPHGQRLSFQGTHSAPGATPGVHFDVLVSDLDHAQQRVVALGGSYVGEHVSPRPGRSGEQVSWRVCRDPDGHLFCLVTR